MQEINSFSKNTYFSVSCFLQGEHGNRFFVDDTVTMKTIAGDTINGTLTAITDRNIEIKTDFGSQVYYLTDIIRVYNEEISQRGTDVDTDVARFRKWVADAVESDGFQRLKEVTTTAWNPKVEDMVEAIQFEWWIDYDMVTITFDESTGEFISFGP